MLQKRDKLEPIDCCPVCGYTDGEFLPWGESGEDPSFDICPCCGVEYGYEDFTVESAAKYRLAWLRRGPKPFRPSIEFRDWDWAVQMRNIMSSEDIEQLKVQLVR